MSAPRQDPARDQLIRRSSADVSRPARPQLSANDAFFLSGREIPRMAHQSGTQRARPEVQTQVGVPPRVVQPVCAHVQYASRWFRASRLPESGRSAVRPVPDHTLIIVLRASELGKRGLATAVARGSHGPKVPFQAARG